MLASLFVLYTASTAARSCAAADQVSVSSMRLHVDQGDSIAASFVLVPAINISSGSVHVRFSVYGIELPDYTRVFNICNIIHGCPLQAGRLAPGMWHFPFLLHGLVGAVLSVEMSFSQGPTSNLLGCSTISTELANVGAGQSRDQQVLAHTLSDSASASRLLQAKAPGWTALFASWQAQFKADVAAASAAKQPQAFQNFQRTMHRLQQKHQQTGTWAQTLDGRAGLSLDAQQTLAHFA